MSEKDLETLELTGENKQQKEMSMSIIGLIVLLLIVGFCSWLIMQIPMDANIKKIIIAIIIFLMVLWTIQSLGFYDFHLKLG